MALPQGGLKAITDCGFPIKLPAPCCRLPPASFGIVGASLVLGIQDLLFSGARGYERHLFTSK